jgi:hypothetical protein
MYLQKIKSIEDMNLLTDKGIYPYEYIGNLEKFNETQLPSIDKFFSSLSGETIKDADYQKAIKVWDHFKCENLGVYHDLYLKTDTLLLADIFENFRCHALEVYKLDPSYYLSLPHYSWDAMKLMTNVKLELLSDPDI